MCGNRHCWRFDMIEKIIISKQIDFFSIFCFTLKMGNCCLKFWNAIFTCGGSCNCCGCACCADYNEDPDYELLCSKPGTSTSTAEQKYEEFDSDE